jgi:sugar (pentulose or hexulose) kinase
VPEAGRWLGIDCGSSGLRGVVVDAAGAVVAEAHRAYPPGTADPAVWAAAMDAVVAELGALGPIAAVAVDGTSGTLLVTDADGRPLEPALLYNDASAADLAAGIAALAPPESAAHGATSPAARLRLLQGRHPAAVHALHQADWLAGRLTGRWGLSDDNNALKLGWDPVARCWPDWLDAYGIRRSLLPEVVEPGQGLGPVTGGPLSGALVVAGTTDGCASFLATGADRPGDGVTALGTTLTLKLLSDRPVFAPQYGIYSHKLMGHWLAGGASNSGGGALLRYFAAEEIAALTPALRPDEPVDLRWHPLPGTGERFPVADPAMTFAPADIPDDRARFLQALMEGVARVEALAYARLRELGAPALRQVRTVGGGARNAAWTAIRARHLGVPLVPATSTDAAYGTALLARKGHSLVRPQ